MTSKSQLYTLLLFLCLSLGSAAAGEDPAVPSAERPTVLEEVERMTEAGEEPEAREALRAWLREHPADAGLPETLEKYFELETDLARLERFLAQLLARMDESPHGALVWEKRANLAELSGEIDRAQEHYVRAAEASSGDRRAVYLMESARLLFEQGYLTRAQNTVATVFLLTDNGTILGLAGILQANIAMELGQTVEAGRILRTLLEDPAMIEVRPQVLLALFLLHQDDETQSGRYLEMLAEDYSESPEYALALRAEGRGAKVTYLFSPRRYLDLYTHETREQDEHEQQVDGGAEDEPAEVEGRGTVGADSVGRKETHEETAGEAGESVATESASETAETGATYSIQTGSFVDRENAEYMVSDLAELGIRATISRFERSGLTYHRVIIPDIRGLDEAREILVRIKGAGFDGFISSSL